MIRRGGRKDIGYLYLLSIYEAVENRSPGKPRSDDCSLHETDVELEFGCSRGINGEIET